MNILYLRSYLFLTFLLLFTVSCKKEKPNNTNPATIIYPFPTIENIGDISMYEINFRAFSSKGNIDGILPRLDSIKN